MSVCVPDMRGNDASAAVRAASPELLVSWFWTKKLPPGVLALAPSVGIHPSLLPRHRGPDPTFWAIDSGDDTTGVTAHTLHEEHGHRRHPRAAGAVDRSVLERLAARARARPSEPGAPPGRRAVVRALRDTARRPPAGRSPRHDGSRAHRTRARHPVGLARRAHRSGAFGRRRRGRGACTEIGDRLAILTHVRVAVDFPRALEPGEAAVREDGIAVVRAGQGAVELLAGRTEDEAVLDASALAAWVVAARDKDKD